MLLDTTGVIIIYALWFVFAFTLAVILLKINS